MYGGRGFYAGKTSGGGISKTIINPIMLRYRPIAPKPVAGGNSSGESPPEKKSDCVSKSRPKRKYVRGKKSKCKTQKAGIRNDELDRTILNQQLSTAVGSGSNHDLPIIQKSPIWLNFDSKEAKSALIAFSEPDLTAAMPPPMRTSESCVTVECVTDACMEGGALGATDIEIVKNLDVDTCPAFVSGGGHKVQWTNLAYRDMVAAAEGGGASPPETAVQLVVKPELPVAYPAFACRVRVEYTWRKGRCSRTIPCDVWRMEFGGFAWRLDVKAALSLGR